MIYGVFSTIFFIFALPFWALAGIFKPKLVNGFKEKCGFYDAIKACGKGHCGEGRTIIFYGVSVGEVLAMENLINKTRETFPNNNIILLTGTKTGQEMAKKKLAQAADFISYFPFDFPFCINNMLDKLKPDAIFVMETELWPNFAYITNKRKIPFFIINARISDRTFKSYRKLKFIFAPILKKYTGIFPQSEQDKQKFLTLGATLETTKTMGNLKFDIKKPDISTLNFAKNLEYKIILAGSTHSSEDEIILDTFVELKKECENLKLIIAPRHPERNENVYKLMQKTGLECAKRSEIPPHPSPLPEGRGSVRQPFADCDIILLDTMGELAKFYSVCDVAFIGGSFNRTGGHNPLEATIFKKPVLSGPSIHNFKDIYAILKCENAAKIVETKNELKTELLTLLKDESSYSSATKACGKVFEENSGALGFVIDVLQSIV